HGEHGDVLLDDRLRLDLEDFAFEYAIRIGLDAYAHVQASVDAAEIGFIDERTYLHFREVGHRQQRGAAGDVLACGRDDLPDLDRLGDDRAVDRRADRHVIQPLARELQV